MGTAPSKVVCRKAVETTKKKQKVAKTYTRSSSAAVISYTDTLRYIAARRFWVRLKAGQTTLSDYLPRSDGLQETAPSSLSRATRARWTPVGVL